MLRFEGGKWVVKGSAVPGSQADGLHEDRVAMMVDDGSVPEFSRYGGYITVGRRLAGFSDEVSGKDVAAHPYLGAKLKQDEPTKYLPATRKSIERGETIAAPLKDTNVFPAMVVQMIGVGEATGALDTMLAKIADFYEDEVDTAVAGLLTLLEPIMIAVLGVIVGGIVIAMYLPIFDLISKLT
mgnify:CR=1 FL=1